MPRCKHPNYSTANRETVPCLNLCNDCNKQFEKHRWGKRIRQKGIDGSSPWHIQKCLNKGCDSEISYDAFKDFFSIPKKA